MTDYKELYWKMFRASEQAMNILITAQKECEELYISSHEEECNVFPFTSEQKKSVDEP